MVSFLLYYIWITNFKAIYPSQKWGNCKTKLEGLSILNLHGRRLIPYIASMKS